MSRARGALRAHSSGPNPSAAGFATSAPLASSGQGEHAYPAATAPAARSSSRGAERRAQVITTGSAVTWTAVRMAARACSGLIAASSQTESVSASCAICVARSGAPAQSDPPTYRAPLARARPMAAAASSAEAPTNVFVSTTSAPAATCAACTPRTTLGCDRFHAGARPVRPRDISAVPIAASRSSDPLRSNSRNLHLLARRGHLDTKSPRGEPRALRLEGGRFAVDEEDAPGRRRSARKPAILLLPVRMRGEAGHLRDLRAHRYDVAAQLQRLRPLEQPASARLLRLVSDEQDGRFRIRQMPLEMRHDPPSGHHPARGDHREEPGAFEQLRRLRGSADELEPRRLERSHVAGDQFAHSGGLVF